MHKYYQGVVIVLLAAFSFALGPAFAKFAYINEVTVMTLLFIRFSLAALALFCYLLITKQNIRLDQRTLLGLFFIGAVCNTMQGFCYFSALKYISASLTVVIAFTYPTITAIVSCLVDHEPITKRIAFSLISSFAGLALMVGTDLQNINVIGVFLATGASLFYTTYVVVGNRILKKVPSIIDSSYVILFYAVGVFMLSLVSSNRINFAFQGAAWPWILGLVVFSTIGILSFLKGVTILGPTKTSVLCTFEPLFGVVIAMIVFHEWLTGIQFLGAAAVIVGALMAVYAPNEHMTQRDVFGVSLHLRKRYRA